MDEIPELVAELPSDFTYKLGPPPAGGGSVMDSTTVNQDSERKIPVTIITGYLGSGKSTLLERIGKTSNKKLAIILNEFGDSSLIEKSVTIQDSNTQVQEWLDLGNGCLCCTVKDNGVVAIENLIANSKDKIDYILLETTGIADPGPIAKMFWLDEGLASNIYIDGVITVVDAQHIITCLDDVGGHWHREHHHLKALQAQTEDITPQEISDEKADLDQGITTAHLQIAIADTILINKIDQLQGDKDKLQQVTDRIRAINETTPIYTTSFGDIELDKILDLHAFEPNFTNIGHHTTSSFHDHRISTVTIDFPYFTQDAQFDKLEKFIQTALWECTINGKPVEIHRLKGILVNTNTGTIKVIQGVRDTYDILDGQQVAEGITTNKLVLIGKDLLYDDISKELQRCLE